MLIESFVDYLMIDWKNSYTGHITRLRTVLGRFGSTACFDRCCPSWDIIINIVEHISDRCWINRPHLWKDYSSYVSGSYNDGLTAV